VSDLETLTREHNAFYTADQLVITHFPEPRWAVPGIIAEGLTVLAGAPKIGKSWLVLGVAIAVANGHPSLGKIDTTGGDVLYAALEDTPRRLKSRLVKMLKGEHGPARLNIITGLPEMPRAIELLDGWLEEHPGARLVIIDVLGKVRPPQGPSTDRYDSDYRTIGQLKRLADKHAVAVVAVTHTRKMGAEDAFDTVSGSTGFTGAADTTVVLRRGRGETSAILHVTGRDVEESEYALTFDALTGSWTLDGNALAEAASRAQSLKATAGLGDKAAEVIEFVYAYPEGVRANTVAAALSLPDSTARQYLKRARDAGRIEQSARGVYVPVTSVTSVTSPESVTSERDSSDARDTHLWGEQP